VRLDPKEGLAEVHEDRGMEDTVGVQIQVLDSIVPEETLEEIAGQVSVRNVVLTLTSNKRRGLSLNGRC
jgi:hypothetical protein